RHPDQRDDAVVHPQAARDRAGAGGVGTVDAQGAGRLHARAVREHPDPHQLNTGNACNASCVMINLSANQLQDWLPHLYWPFVRIGSCFMVAPAFGAATVPPRVRIVLAGAVTLVILPLLPAPPAVSAFSGTGFVITAQQVLIGTALGFCLQI